jgi:hypothetical protein
MSENESKKHSTVSATSSSEIETSLRATRANINYQQELTLLREEQRGLREELSSMKATLENTSLALGTVLINLTELMQRLSGQASIMTEAAEQTKETIKNCVKSARDSFEVLEPQILISATEISNYAPLIKGAADSLVTTQVTLSQILKKRQRDFWIVATICMVLCTVFGWNLRKMWIEPDEDASTKTYRDPNPAQTTPTKNSNKK